MLVTDFRCSHRNRHLGDKGCHQHPLVVTNTFCPEYPSPKSMLPFYYSKRRKLGHSTIHRTSRRHQKLISRLWSKTTYFDLSFLKLFRPNFSEFFLPCDSETHEFSFKLGPKKFRRKKILVGLVLWPSFTKFWNWNVLWYSSLRLSCLWFSTFFWCRNFIIRKFENSDLVSKWIKILILNS